MTMGIAVVARLAACAAGVLTAKITVNLQPYKFVCLRHKRLAAAIRKAPLDGEISPLNITEFVESFRKSFQRPRRKRTERKHPDPVDLPRLLCLSAIWRREQAQDERDDGPNSAVPHGRLLASVSCRSSSAPA
jgi:hypothetical protein